MRYTFLWICLNLYRIFTLSFADFLTVMLYNNGTGTEDVKNGRAGKETDHGIRTDRQCFDKTIRPL